MNKQAVLEIASLIMDEDPQIKSFTIESNCENYFIVSITKNNLSAIERFIYTNQEEAKLFFISPMLQRINKMTPFEMPIERIVYNPKLDKREHDIGVQDLAEHIKTHGMFSPIIINANNEIVAGFRRYKACKLNGAKTIKVQYNGRS